MKKTITIDGKDITFVATARTPLLYKQWIGKDLFTEMNRSQTDQAAALDVFSKLAYVMARQADPEIGDIDEWFDSFGLFSLYTALPQLTSMWNVETATSVETKKKQADRKGADNGSLSFAMLSEQHPDQ